MKEIQSRYFDINGEGNSIKTKLYYNDIRNIGRVVLFGHGFGGHKDNKAAEKFAERALSKYKDVAVVTYDWPCHGDDVKRKLNLADCMQYIKSVLSFVQSQYEPESVFVYATSFGAYLFLKYVHDEGNPFQKLVFRGPAVNMYKSVTENIMTEADFEKINKGKEAGIGFDRKINVGKSFLEEIQATDIMKYDYLDYADDMLIIQGTGDEIIPYDVVRKFSEDNVIEMVSVNGADHRFTDPKKMDTAIHAIFEFFDF